jgi:carotenoid cleavage dioxygenase-like enzyme
VASEGRITHEIGIDLGTPVMMHDFAVTEHYSILMDLPLTFRRERLLSGEPLIQFERDRPARFGILPRHGGKEPVWFVTDPLYIFHTANAWEEEGGKRVVLIACRSQAVFLFSNDRKYSDRNHSYQHEQTLNGDIPNNGNGEDGRGRGQNGEYVSSPYLYRFTFDMETGECSQEPLDVHPAEFPKINPSRLGLPSRYCYLVGVVWGVCVVCWV